MINKHISYAVVCIGRLRLEILSLVLSLYIYLLSEFDTFEVIYSVIYVCNYFLIFIQFLNI